ncbi:ATP-grasp domain-containing protein [Paraburkholderia sediminicola]|uniref:ATP-grasp domain-containing protein n=1 Tax=Paraburkholderia sediminicola TaxID=458836 RepID=UPI0038BC39C8
MTQNPDYEADRKAQPPDTSAEHASDSASLDPSRHRALAEARRADGDELGAVAHLIAAHTLNAYAAGAPNASTVNLCDVATGYFMKGDHGIAEYWYRLVLKLDPHVAVVCQNLAAILTVGGHVSEAAAYRERAYRIQRVFIEGSGAEQRRVLILCAAHTAGNVPFDALLPSTLCCRIKYAIDYTDDEEDQQLPAYDLVFNAIGDADIAAPLSGRLARFVSRCARPVLNPPDAIARTQRHRTASLFDELPDVQVAPCVRSEVAPASRSALDALLAAGGIDFPVLARPAATHGGDGLTLCESLAALESWRSAQTEVCYLTAFRDYRSADGFYRKYRIIFVDREPFPYHLAISPHWMVHYYSADMEQHPWKLEEERRFLDNPQAVFGEQVMSAIAAIGKRLDLDYGGIDFTVLPGGQVLVFEANATMLAHFERETGALAHKNPYVQRIVDAFERMMSRHHAT